MLTSAARLGRLLTAAGVLLAAASVCPAWPQSLDRTNSGAVRQAIQALIGADDVPAFVTAEEREELRTLYLPACAPAWLDSNGVVTRAAHDALSVLAQAADEGLAPEDYNPDLLSRLEHDAARADALRERAQFDVTLSASMLRYLRDLHIGRIDRRLVGFRLGTGHDDDDFVALLRAAIRDDRVASAAAALRPPLHQYRLLLAMLPRYRSLAAGSTWTCPRVLTRAVHPGEAYPDAGILRDALLALGDLSSRPAGGEALRYDGELVVAVRRFQSRHGLEADGVLGKTTVAALCVPPARRVRQVELSLERLRWLPDVGRERLVALNIPMFRLWAWDTSPQDGTPAFDMNVIVGRALRTQTPVLAAEMNEVIFRPYWNVPSSILRHEVIPKIERDPAYLRRQNMEIIGASGEAAAPLGVTAATLAGLRRGALRVRQRPGPTNALGLIKFVFPNEQGVYMHGTPEQALFARTRRDFSHGCVRVADPVALAEWVLRDIPEWTRDRIVDATHGSQTMPVQLPHPIQVILFYTTAAVASEDGTIRFADDIYGHDRRLDAALDDLHRRRLGAPR